MRTVGEKCTQDFFKEANSPSSCFVGIVTALHSGCVLVGCHQSELQFWVVVVGVLPEDTYILMQLRTWNTWDPLSKEWSLSLEVMDGDPSAIQNVTFVLHPALYQPASRAVPLCRETRSFRLTEHGDAPFTVSVVLRTSSATLHRIQHPLLLLENAPDVSLKVHNLGKGTTAVARPPSPVKEAEEPPAPVPEQSASDSFGLGGPYFRPPRRASRRGRVVARGHNRSSDRSSESLSCNSSDDSSC